MSFIDIGEKFHVITRRLFEDDLRRHFVGKVTRMHGDVVELEGYAFVFSSNTNEFRRRKEIRSRILCLGDAGHIVNTIPTDVDLAKLEYRLVAKRLVLTDGGSFSLDINEFSHTH
jgi:hypothetical protein